MFIYFTAQLKHILELPKVNTTTYGLKSLCYTAAKIWNTLSDQFRATNKIGTFKNLMAVLDLSNFNCNRANTCKYILRSFNIIM